MKKPEMIIFDYGHTLLYEPGNNFLRGTEAVMRHAVKNPNGITAQQIYEFDTYLFEKAAVCRKQGFEMHEWQFMRLAYEYFGIELDVSLAEAELILWDAVSEGACMPYAEEMIAFLKENGIRSGVISNLGWSGEALTNRLNRLLPDNNFEFVIASSDYGLRKPDRLLFELALRKAGLDASKVWYCGDSIKADVNGAHGVGIFPVWYEDMTVENPWRGADDGISVEFEHLHIHDWREMIEVLKELLTIAAR